MNRVQKFSQAPWRWQVQIIAIFSGLLIVIAAIALIYLTVSARAAATGRRIQKAQANIEAIDREIEDLKSLLASTRSSAEMENRARALGFEPLSSDQMVYMNIPGYPAQRIPQLAPVAQRTMVSARMRPAEYTESLFAWLRRRINGSASSLVEWTP